MHQLAHGQLLKVSARRARRANDYRFRTRRCVKRGNAHLHAKLHKLEKDFPTALARALGARVAHAAGRTEKAAQTVFIASTSFSIRSSSWNGDGVKRSRSVPRGTVGKLIGCT